MQLHSLLPFTPNRPILAPDRSTVYLPTPRRVLGVWAHPDDEAYLAAGLMDRVVRAGGHVTVVALTDGEAGFGVDDSRSVTARRALRRDELRAAMAEIGVSDIRFLGLPDGEVAEADPVDLADAIARVVDEVRPEVTVTFGPDGVTGHADHVACSRRTTSAWLDRPCGQLWYAAKTVDWLDEWRSMHDRLGIWMTEEPAGVSGVDVHASVRLSPAEVDRKRAVLAAHASQTGGVAAAFGENDYRRWIGEETFRSPSADELRSVGAAAVLVGGARP